MSMEKLIQDSVDCRKDHKTYEKWKLDHPGDPSPRKGHSPIGARYCEVCGAVLRPRQHHFCSADCRDVATKRNKRKKPT